MSHVQIPASFRPLLTKRAFAHLATLMQDGSPQVTPVWFEYDGEFFIINSARGRTKDRNIERERRVALAIQDPDDPYRYLQVRGQVVEITEEGADEVIDHLARKYLGVDVYPGRSKHERRVTYKIKPLAITSVG